MPWYVWYLLGLLSAAPFVLMALALAEAASRRSHLT